MLPRQTLIVKRIARAFGRNHFVPGLGFLSNVL
jgi:hypothetical protein